mmetsp:Transcript_30104/g.54503  ORF Transcript_30104/g.54503 Transcript_30104/m.54503 type:complete len:95 (+) Transcript_30104:33-317(+)
MRARKKNSLNWCASGLLPKQPRGRLNVKLDLELLEVTTSVTSQEPPKAAGFLTFSACYLPLRLTELADLDIVATAALAGRVERFGLPPVLHWLT